MQYVAELSSATFGDRVLGDVAAVSPPHRGRRHGDTPAPGALEGAAGQSEGGAFGVDLGLYVHPQSPSVVEPMVEPVGGAR